MSALFRATKTAEFDRLYRQHAASVFRYAFAVLGSRADAEDVAQHTFLKAYSAIAQGTICGLGIEGYRFAIDFALKSS